VLRGSPGVAEVCRRTANGGELRANHPNGDSQ
jgi:hypothetical protein